MVWDSGKVSSDESVYVKYEGEALLYDTKYFWTVKVWTNQSKRATQSKIMNWKTGLMNADNWKSNWITVNDEDMTSPKKSHILSMILEWIVKLFQQTYILLLGVYMKLILMAKELVMLYSHQGGRLIQIGFSIRHMT